MKISRFVLAAASGGLLLLSIIFVGGFLYGRAAQQQRANQEIAAAEDRAIALEAQLADARLVSASGAVRNAEPSPTEGDVIGIRMWHEDCAYIESAHGVQCPTIRAEVLLLDIAGTSARTGWTEVTPDFLMGIDWSWHCDLENSVCVPPS